MNRSLSIWVAMLLMVFAGCSMSGTYPVQGKLVFEDGSPATELAGFTISFDSADLKEGANGVVQGDGTFKIGTYENDDGAKPGHYRVSLTPPDPPIDTPRPKPIIDAKYGDLDKSGLTADVKAADNNLELTVERLKK